MEKVLHRFFYDKKENACKETMHYNGPKKLDNKKGDFNVGLCLVSNRFRIWVTRESASAMAGQKP